MRVLFLACLISTSAWAGGQFDNYQWRMGFQMGGGHYQPTLKITYDYKGSSAEDASALSVPRDDNLVVQKVQFKVDGKKVDARPDYQVTYYSYGKEVPVLLPDGEGSKVSVTAFYLIKNMFIIPPAPSDLSIPVKKLEVGFAPLKKFEFSGSFIGPTYKFKGKKVAAKQGEPSALQMFSRKNVEANGGTQGLFFLVPKNFNFSFNLLRGAQQSGNASSAGPGSPGGATTAGGTSASSLGIAQGTFAGDAGGGDADINSGDLKPYSMVFYSQKPQRDWKFAPTWLQQERTYLPFGILPGGRVKSRTLFPGAGSKEDDLVSWLDEKPRTSGDSIKTPGQTSQSAPYQAIDLFVKDFRGTISINSEMSRHVAYESKDGMSPAMANKLLATEINHRFKLKTAPALMCVHDPKLVASLPLAAFDGVVTGVNIQGRWFFIDAANREWDLRSAATHLKGHNVIILDDQLQMANF